MRSVCWNSAFLYTQICNKSCRLAAFVDVGDNYSVVLLTGITAGIAAGIAAGCIAAGIAAGCIAAGIAAGCIATGIAASCIAAGITTSIAAGIAGIITCST